MMGAYFIQTGGKNSSCVKRGFTMRFSKSRKNIRRTALLLAGLTLAAVLPGCAPIPMTPGGEPFGEQTASQDRTKRVYEAFAEEFRQETQESWDGFTITWMDRGESTDVDLYRTEAYTLAYCERTRGGEYLWYDGWLYCREGEAVACCEMPWEALQTDQITAGLWTMLQGLLDLTPEEMEYKSIPMSSKSGNLLTVKYPFGEDRAGDYAMLSVPLYGDGHYESVSLQWQDIGELGKFENVSVIAAFCPLPGSDSLQAERKVWSFAHDCGLLEQGVPAISAQDEDREGCRAVIAGIDFAALRARAERREDLSFPEFPFQCFGPEPESNAGTP